MRAKLRRRGMSRRRGYKRAARPRKAIAILLIILIISMGLFFYADSCIRPTIVGMASTQAQAMSTLVINQAVTEYLNSVDIDYDSLVTLQRDADGQVKSVQTNMSRLNTLKAEITTKAQDALLQYTKDSVTIPIGNLTGIDFFTGKGPKIQITYETSCSATSNISGSFESGGINQVLHKITLDIQTRIFIMIPGNQTLTTSSSSFCVAETVIVGMSPNSYANLTDDYMNGPSIVD